MAIDFRSLQIQTRQIISTGSLGDGLGGAKLVIYDIGADDTTTPNQGVINQLAFNTGSLNGRDIFLFISGGIGHKDSSNQSISVFGGDVHISGALSLAGGLNVVDTDWTLTGSTVYTTSSVVIGESLKIEELVATDSVLYVSGGIGVNVAVFGGDLWTSGTINTVSPTLVQFTASITAETSANNLLIGGTTNEISGTSAQTTLNAIVGGSSHIIHGDTVGAASRRNFIGGGTNATINVTSDDNAIVGGSSHIISSGSTNAIVGGFTNEISGGLASVIISSFTSDINRSFSSVIIGGLSNSLTNGTGSVIIGGGWTLNTTTATVAIGGVTSGEDYRVVVSSANGMDVHAGPIRAWDGLSGSLQHLADGSAYLLAGNDITLSTGSSGQVTIAASAADPDASYIVLGATASLPNERVLTAGNGIDFVDGGAGGALTINNSGDSEWQLSGSTLYTTSSVVIGQAADIEEIGDDINFYVSGTITSGSDADNIALFGGSLKVSGVLSVGSGSTYIHEDAIYFNSASVRVVTGSVVMFDNENLDGVTLTSLRNQSANDTTLENVMTSGSIDNLVVLQDANPMILVSSGGLAFNVSSSAALPSVTAGQIDFTAPFDISFSANGSSLIAFNDSTNVSFDAGFNGSSVIEVINELSGNITTLSESVDGNNTLAEIVGSGVTDNAPTIPTSDPINYTFGGTTQDAFRINATSLTDGSALVTDGGSVVLSSSLHQVQGLKLNPNAISGSYTVIDTDYLIATSSSAAFTVTLPASPTNGQIFKVKDAGGSSATHNVTVSSSGDQIDGDPTFIIAVNYAAFEFTYYSEFSTWGVS